jgi:heme O synthase-like polyprenyltransferase
MKTNTIIFLATLAVLMFYSTMAAKDMSLDDDSDEEMTQEEKRMLVRSMLEVEDDDASFYARKLKPGCVRCRLFFQCCLPNVCHQHTIMNKCQRIKAPKA